MRCNIDVIFQCCSGESLAKTKCSVVEFKCSNGRCVADMSVCNEVDDCGDLSDELACCEFYIISYLYCFYIIIMCPYFLLL